MLKTYLSLLILLLSSTVVLAQDMHDICPLKVGAEIPDGTLVDENGDTHTLTSLTTDKPTVVIFYRGAWCGYCTKHLAELNDVKADIEAKGYQIFGVTVDQPSKLEESQTRPESEIEVYSDSSVALIKAFGLDWKVSEEMFDKYKNKYNLDLEAWSGDTHHSLPVPAVFIIKDGVVQFQYVNPNYNTRLKATTLLAVLETL
ncbi:MAG: peroxiredoxin-like family protein [Bacteroidia bacterium]